MQKLISEWEEWSPLTLCYIELTRYVRKISHNPILAGLFSNEPFQIKIGLSDNHETIHVKLVPS